MVEAMELQNINKSLFCNALGTTLCGPDIPLHASIDRSKDMLSAQPSSINHRFIMRHAHRNILVSSPDNFRNESRVALCQNYQLGLGNLVKFDSTAIAEACDRIR